MPSSTLTAKASYKKLNGLLELTSSHLQWTQDGKKAPSVRVPLSDAAGQFAMGCVPYEDGALTTFMQHYSAAKRVLHRLG